MITIYRAQCSQQSPNPSALRVLSGGLATNCSPQTQWLVQWLFTEFSNCFWFKQGIIKHLRTTISISSRGSLQRKQMNIICIITSWAWFWFMLAERNHRLGHGHTWSRTIPKLKCIWIGWYGRITRTCHIVHNGAKMEELRHSFEYGLNLEI